jgi:hypothetical protein
LKFLTRPFTLLVLIALLIAACDTAIPAPPAVTVVVTVVDDTQALNDAVTQAVGATEQAAIAATGTILAQGGVTYTPSPTLTPSSTPTATPTRIVTATRTPLPTETATPTFAPFLTSEPPPVDIEAPSWLRILNTWQRVAGDSGSTTVDVYVNDSRISRALAFSEQSSYFQVLPGAAQISLRNVDSNLTTQTAPLLNTVVEVPAGVVMSLVIADLGDGLTLIPVQEDLTPLPSGTSRVTIVQANPELLPVDLLVPNAKRGLAYNLQAGQVIGPYEVPSSSYIIDLYDVRNPATPLESLPPVDLTPRLNYVLVLSPYRGPDQKFTASVLFANNTHLLDTEVTSRFIHFAPGVGALNVQLDNETIFTNLRPGTISEAVPVSTRGSRLAIEEGAAQVYSGVLGPWTSESESESDKIVLIGDGATFGSTAEVAVITLSQNPPRSAINASIRLIHALPGGVPFSLEVRRVAPPGESSTENPWIPVAQASAGEASAYASRTPDTFDVRVVQATSRTPLAILPNVQMLAGGVYDFVVLTGAETGSAQLELIQPTVQITNLANRGGDPEVINEAVQATLNALIPPVTSTPTVMNTATPTLTPIATNTPRPTNTPSILTPIVIIDPAPPDTVVGTFLLQGFNFVPGERFVIKIDDDPTEIMRGRVDEDGRIEVEVRVPAAADPGTHTIRVCVDCVPNGAQQAAFAPILVADPLMTPSPTPVP